MLLLPPTPTRSKSCYVATTFNMEWQFSIHYVLFPQLKLYIRITASRLHFFSVCWTGLGVLSLGPFARAAGSPSFGSPSTSAMAPVRTLYAVLRSFVNSINWQSMWGSFLCFVSFQLPCRKTSVLYREVLSSAYLVFCCNFRRFATVFRLASVLLLYSTCKYNHYPSHSCLPIIIASYFLWFGGEVPFQLGLRHNHQSYPSSPHTSH